MHRWSASYWLSMRWSAATFGSTGGGAPELHWKQTKTCVSGAEFSVLVHLMHYVHKSLKKQNKTKLYVRGKLDKNSLNPDVLSRGASAVLTTCVQNFEKLKN